MTHTREELNRMKVTELRELATNMEIPGRSYLKTKDDIIDAIFYYVSPKKVVVNEYALSFPKPKCACPTRVAPWSNLTNPNRAPY